VPFDLSRVAESVDTRLGAKHRAREDAFTESRKAIRASANAIRAIHRRERAEADDLVAQAGDALRAAIAACEGQPEVRWAGFVHDAAKEYAEARLTVALVTQQPLPSPDELGVEDTAWLNGAAEAIGELRRHLLDELRAGRLERCEELLAAMDEIHSVLVGIDYPDAVTAGLRRSTDVARSIIERTRGDLTTALVQARLRDALDAHARDLREA
jgi:translin